MSTETPLEAPPALERRKRRMQLATCVFVIVYFSAVVAGALWLKKDIWNPRPLGLILGAPALFALAIAAPSLRRNPTRLSFLMFGLLLPVMTVLFLGGTAVLVALMFVGM